MDTEMRAGWRVSGRVQGVGFRWWTARQARALGLAGSVRNLPDGSVEVFAAGPTQAVRRLEERLREGPAGASVTALEPLQPSAGALPAPFTITR
jgi:acylphosphatase